MLALNFSALRASQFRLRLGKTKQSAFVSFFVFYSASTRPDSSLSAALGFVEKINKFILFSSRLALILYLIDCGRIYNGKNIATY